MQGLLTVAMVAALANAGAKDVLTLELHDREGCARLKDVMAPDNAEVSVSVSERGCSLKLPGPSAWAARPSDVSDLLQLAGLTRDQQADLDALMDRLARDKVAEAHLRPREGHALMNVQDATDDFNGVKSQTDSCTCAWATVEEGRGWVGWVVRPTGACGNGLFSGDSPAWCPESDRFVPMTLGVAAVLVVALALIVRRMVKRQRHALAAAAAGAATPKAAGAAANR